MKVKVDEQKLKSLMWNKKIYNYSQLALQSGASLWSIKSGLSHYGTLSREVLWLISETLGCSINDFVYPDWEN